MKFETDYIISWDISDKDFPRISVARLAADGSYLTLDVLDVAHEKSGVVSLRQLIEEWERSKQQQVTSK